MDESHSPDTESPDTASPLTESPDTETPNIETPNIETPDIEHSTARAARAATVTGARNRLTGHGSDPDGQSKAGNSAAIVRPESYTWPLIALALMILTQLVIPDRDRLGPDLGVPVVEIAVFAVMAAIAALPGAVPRRARPVILTLFGCLVAANATAAARLVYLVLANGKIDGVLPSATRLLTAGAIVVATNVITFALLYWQLDGGGPAGRIAQPPPAPDFQFPQTPPSELTPGWRPRFADHLYVAYTNVVSFSPTDTMPLTHRAKGLMALQSIISAAVLIVVLSRVINLLPA